MKPRVTPALSSDELCALRDVHMHLSGRSERISQENILTKAGFYKGKRLDQINISKQSSWLLAAQTQVESYVCKDLVPHIMSYLGSSDVLIIDEAIHVWIFLNGGRGQKHWLHEKAEDQGVLSVIVYYSNEFIRCGESEYVELVLQFLLHHQQDGLHNMLLAMRTGCLNHPLVMEAINQAWEIENWPKKNFLCVKEKGLRTRDCVCFFCKKNYCQYGSSKCQCRDRRRHYANMNNELVDVPWWQRAASITMDEVQLTKQIDAWEKYFFLEADQEDQEYIPSRRDCFNRIAHDLRLLLK